ncbi:hypothetical protein, partial [Nevskia soli]|uniref:hypothetical protein n=1 Tax=Nevskia soli TaxID=418856 RepID=UPI0015D7A820
MKILILILAGAFAAFAQTSTQNTFVSTTGDVTLSNAATAATLQQSALNSATGAKDIAITYATVFCSAACTVTHTINSAAATATAGAPVAQPG